MLSIITNWLWWEPAASPARNLPDTMSVKSCPIIVTVEEVIHQLNNLRKTPPPTPKTDFEPSELHAQLVAKWHEMKMARLQLTA